LVWWYDLAQVGGAIQQALATAIDEAMELDPILQG
jgi:hypothetical protein